MANRQVLFGLPNYMQLIPCPLSGMETTIAGNKTTTSLLNGRNFIGGSMGVSRQHSVSWIGTQEELQPIIDYASGVYGDGPFYYTDPMAMENALSPVYAAPHLLEDIEHRFVTGTQVVRYPASGGPYNLPAYSAYITRYAAIDYTKPTPMTVAIPAGYKAVVHVFASQATAVRVAVGTSSGFALAAQQPAQVVANFYWRQEYSGVDFVSLHFGPQGVPVFVYGLRVQLLPINAPVPTEAKWYGGLGHTAMKFSPEGLAQTSYMSKEANGKGLIGLSGTLVEV